MDVETDELEKLNGNIGTNDTSTNDSATEKSDSKSLSESSINNNVANESDNIVIKSEDQNLKTAIDSLKNQKPGYPPTPPRESPEQKMVIDEPDSNLPVDLSDCKPKSAKSKSDSVKTVEITKENSTEDDQLTQIKKVRFALNKFRCSCRKLVAHQL